MTEPAWRAPAARVTIVLASVFCAWGMASPFLPRWLAVERGLTGSEIGAVLSAAMLARVIAGPALAAWSDGFADRRVPLRLIAAAALASWALFFFVEGFWLLFAIGFIAQTLGQSLSPMAEAMVLRAADPRVPYGVSRAFGSMAFILGNVGGGAAVAALGLGATPAWVLASLTVAALASWFALSHDAAPPAAPGFRRRLRAGFAYVRTPRVMLLLLGCACIQASHAFYYGFSALVWRGQEISATTVGLLWGFAVSVEVILLFMLPRVERRFKPETFILIGAGAGIVRWSLMAFAPTGFLLWPLQLLHTLTFAPAHVGALRVIVRDAPEDMAMFTQIAYAALQAGLFMGLATLASGWLYDHVGAGGYWLMTALSAAGFALIWKFVQDGETKTRPA